MIAAQYEIVLPTDYDMGVIRRRVAERGHALDDRPGLGLKAYLVREVTDGAAVNAYAPFYLWNDPAALAAFHWGGAGFAGIVRDFGRPVVRTWIGGAHQPGPAADRTPTHAEVTHRTLPPDVDPQASARDLAAAAREAAGEATTHGVAWAIDPTTWRAVVFRLATARPAPDGPGTAYRVLHLSAPEVHALR